MIGVNPFRRTASEAVDPAAERAPDVAVDRRGIGPEASVLQAALDALPASIVVLDGHGTIVATNEAWRAWAVPDGAQDGTATVGMSYQAAHRSVCGDRHQKVGLIWSGVKSVLQGRRDAFHTTFACVRRSGTRHFHLTATPLGNGQRGAVVSHVDITERVLQEGRLRFEAEHDALTGLRNRRSFMVEAGKALALAERHGHEFTLLFLDLDGFKAVNDRHGHDVGDEVLCVVAERLAGIARESDVVARVGGDEFMILLQETSEDSRLRAASRFSSSLDAPFHLLDRTFEMKGSIGVAHYPRHGYTLDRLVKTADAAMYRAKAAGGGIHVHD